MEVQYNWLEKKDQFWKSCDDLELGELVHDGLFGLFEAMSAIEIMDAKMDAGMRCNKKRDVLQLHEAIEKGKMKVKGFSVEELIGIIDELLACFVTWLDGQSLVQSVFVCMFCHDPSAIEEPILKAVCICVLKMVDIVRNIILKAKVFEEEDFQPMTYSFKLANDVTIQRVSGMLKEAENFISKRIKTCNTDGEQENMVKLNKILKSRIMLLQSFYNAMLCFSSSDGLEVSRCRDFIKTAIELLADNQQTLSCGLQADITQDHYIPGFDLLVNQRLLPPSFPRQAEIFQREQAMVYLKVLLERLEGICSVLECSTLEKLLKFLSSYSKKLPCVLSRSVLQLLVFHQNCKMLGKYSLAEMIKDSIRLFNASASVADLSPLASQESKVIVNEFLVKAKKPLSLLMEAYGHNRARQRERLASLLEDFGILQQEAYQVDQTLHQQLANSGSKRQHLFCFESWVLHHALSIMMQHMYLGFELDLFCPHEYHYVYWYIDYLLSWASNCLHRAEVLLLVQEQSIEKKLGKKEKKKKKEILSACTDRMNQHKKLRFKYNVIKEICQGLIKPRRSKKDEKKKELKMLKAYEALSKDGKIKEPSVYFDNEKIRFEHRFASFTFIDTRQENHYKEYKQATFNQELGSKDLYLLSMNHFQRAIEFIQQINFSDQDLQHLMEISKKNYIAMKITASGHKIKNEFAVWDFGVHQCYPLIKVM